MDFTYTEEQRAVRDMMQSFVEKEVAPRAAQIDATGQFPYDIYKKLGELGIIGMSLPEEAGGAGADILSLCLAVEELSRADSGFGPVFTAQQSSTRHILRYAREPQRSEWIEKYVKPVARGEATGATALTEPDNSSSDAKGMRTTAVREGNEYVINGTKIFSTAAGLDTTTFILVWAIVDKQTKKSEMFLVPSGTPGLVMGRALHKLGMRGAETRELFFDNCRVPVDNILDGGKSGEASPVGETQFHSRLLLASNAIGLHRFCLEESLRFAKNRVTFGIPLSQRQMIQGWLAEMATELEVSRLMRDRAAWRYDRGEMTIAEAAMVKYTCTQNAAKAADYATEIHGGMGFMEESPVVRRYRDAKGLTIIQGGATLQKWIVAEQLIAQNEYNPI